jgi:hypothetical protein
VKNLIFTLLLLGTSFSVVAASVTSKIHSLDTGKKGKPHLLKLTTGEVAFIEFGDKSLLKQLEQSQIRGDRVQIELDKNHNLIGLRVLSAPKDIIFNDHLIDTEEDYLPSIITSKKATSIFSKMSRKYQKKSQCFNRAHIWVYDEFSRSGTKLNKVFLFFTSRYIRKYRFHWWFHVTPMAYVGGKEFKNWRMLDRRYTKGPLQSKAWTDIFMKSKRTCPVVYTFNATCFR